MTEGTELFDDTPGQTPAPVNNDVANPLEELVGENKKFKTIEDLAKSKLEADRFIEQLKGEIDGMRTDLDNRLKMEEYLSKLDQRAKDKEDTKTMTKEVSNQGNTTSEENSGKQMSIEEIEAIVEKRVSERETRSRVEQNLNKVQQMGEKAFGPDYRKVFAEKAKQLGFDVEVLTEMAQRSPDGFLNIMGASEAIAKLDEDTTSQVLFGGGKGATNSEAQARISTSGKPKMSDFTKMRKENPKQYWTPEVQNRLMKYTSELGSDFLDN